MGRKIEGEKFLYCNLEMGCLKILHSDQKSALSKSWKIFVGGVEKSASGEKNRINYYPFGMLQPGRSYSSPSYRYGFNGMEKDDEISGNSYTTTFRQYDPRLGRWFSTDHMALFNESPYSGFMNNPIYYTDGEGDCPWCIKLILDFSAGVAADVFIQVIADFAFGDASSIGDAFDNVDWIQATWSGAENVLPAGKHTKAVISAIVDVTSYYFNTENPSLGGATKEFLVGLGSAYMGDFISKYGADVVAKGLKKIGLDDTVIKKLTGKDIEAKIKKNNNVNGGLAGGVHPVTGVPFDKDGFPDFSGNLYKGADGLNSVKIDYTGNRTKDFARANKKAGFDSTPDGYTWHHHQDTKTMQLVETSIHGKTGHTGGFSIWKKKNPKPRIVKSPVF